MNKHKEPKERHVMCEGVHKNAKKPHQRVLTARVEKGNGEGGERV